MDPTRTGVSGGIGAYVILGLVVAATLGVVVVIAWALAMMRQPRALVASGQWHDAALAAESLGRSWLRIFPSVREEAAHVRAACLHLEGKLDASLEALRGLGTAAAASPEVALLEGANLVMAGRDATRAVERLIVACASPRSSPEDLLFLALAKHAAGDATSAEETFAKAGRARPKNAPSPRIYEPAFHYLRGLYLVKTGRAAEAADDLEAAARDAPLASIYVVRARALVATELAGEPDPRSSLTGQVIDE